MGGSGKAPIYGPEPWSTRQATVWSYWDLWFCVVALADHDGDLDALAEAIEEGGRLSGTGTAEAKLSHLDDLRRRMAAAGIDAEALVADEDTDPKIRAKARTKVHEQGLYPRDMTEPMWHTPRERLYERALRGRWHVFPVTPEPFYERLCNGLGERFRSKGQTFKLAHRLRAAIERTDRTTTNSAPQRLGARRALVAWCYGTMKRCDDSYGVIGELARDALLNYATLRYEPVGIAARDWCEDLCELLSWRTGVCFTAMRPDLSPSCKASSPNTPRNSCSRSQTSYALTASATRPTRRFRTSNLDVVSTVIKMKALAPPPDSSRCGSAGRRRPALGYARSGFSVPRGRMRMS